MSCLCNACCTGPSEGLIGQYLAAYPEEQGKVQVLTKFCCFGDSMKKAADLRYVETVRLPPVTKSTSLR